MYRPKPQEIYRHFKGRLYQVLTIATHSETGEEMVIYQALYGDFAIYCRPLYLFTEVLDAARYPEATQSYRFEKVEPMSETIRKKPDKPDVPQAVKAPGQAARPADRAHARREEQAAERQSVMSRTIEEEAEALRMDPRVIAFLDADSTDVRLRILDELHHDVTDDQIDVMAMAVDAQVAEGEIYDRFFALRDVLKTRQRFESNRLRG